MVFQTLDLEGTGWDQESRSPAIVVGTVADLADTEQQPDRRAGDMRSRLTHWPGLHKPSAAVDIVET